jgi:hypothetical protein
MIKVSRAYLIEDLLKRQNNLQGEGIKPCSVIDEYTKSYPNAYGYKLKVMVCAGPTSAVYVHPVLVDKDNKKVAEADIRDYFIGTHEIIHNGKRFSVTIEEEEVAELGYDEIHLHIGHEIEVVQYGDGVNVAIECLTCQQVIASVDR